MLALPIALRSFAVMLVLLVLVVSGLMVPGLVVLGLVQRSWYHQSVANPSCEGRMCTVQG
jgi:hypothetical protein